MNTIQLNDVQALLDRIQTLVTSVPDQKARLVLTLERVLRGLRDELKLDPGVWTLAPERWEALDPTRQEPLRQELIVLLDAIQNVIETDGPSDQTSIMYKQYASNRDVVSLTLLGAVATLAMLGAILLLWDAATAQRKDVGPPEGTVLLMIVMMGALGGLLRLTNSLAKFVGNRQLYRSWIVYYLLMPIEGAALAPAVYLLLRVGVLAPGTASGSNTSNLNLFALYAFAGLTGLFAKNAIDMLADTFSVIFKKVEAKDPLQGDRAAAAGPPKPLPPTRPPSG